jgi:hypothetical protein
VEIDLVLQTVAIICLPIIVILLLIIQNQGKNQAELAKRENALSYSITKNESLREARIELDQEFEQVLYDKKGALPLQTIHEAIHKQKSIRTNILVVLGHWENMALAIHRNIADEETAYQMVAGVFRSHVRTFKEFIEDRRENNPNAYKHLLRLDIEWNEKN